MTIKNSLDTNFHICLFKFNLSYTAFAIIN